jgi:hypothetical protein
LGADHTGNIQKENDKRQETRKAGKGNGKERKKEFEGEGKLEIT